MCICRCMQLFSLHVCPLCVQLLCELCAYYICSMYICTVYIIKIYLYIVCHANICVYYVHKYIKCGHRVCICGTYLCLYKCISVCACFSMFVGGMLKGAPWLVCMMNSMHSVCVLFICLYICVYCTHRACVMVFTCVYYVYYGALIMCAYLCEQIYASTLFFLGLQWGAASKALTPNPEAPAVSRFIAGSRNSNHPLLPVEFSSQPN